MQLKNKISLSDYQYKRDVEGRIFISELSSIEVHILKELINQSTKFTLFELSESAEVDIESIEPIIDKFSQIGLVLRQNHNIFVNKDIRKYFELHIHKFDNGFRPGFDFVRNLLNKIPVSALPVWYDTPRTSDNIFESILEKYAHTPKLYAEYLKGLTFQTPVIANILRDVLQSPEFEVPATVLQQKYNLSKEKFHEYVLLLEFHLALISTFKEENGNWIEVITPIHEWRQLLKLEQQKTPRVVPTEKVQPLDEREFAFFLNLQALIADLKKAPLTEDSREKALIEKALVLGLVEKNDDLLTLVPEADEFTQLPFQEQIFILYKRSVEVLQDRWNSTFGPIERTIREIQKRLHKLPHSQWFFFEDFAESLFMPIGNQPPVCLKSTGKKWAYTVPKYTQTEKEFVYSLISELLFQTGLVNCGYAEEKRCFMITSFGHVSLSE